VLGFDAGEQAYELFVPFALFEAKMGVDDAYSSPPGS
jgi:hypothetical protein